MKRRHVEKTSDERWSVYLILLVLLCGWSIVVLLFHPRDEKPCYELSPNFVETLTEAAGRDPIYVPGVQ